MNVFKRGGSRFKRKWNDMFNRENGSAPKSTADSNPSFTPGNTNATAASTPDPVSEPATPRNSTPDPQPEPAQPTAVREPSTSTRPQAATTAAPAAASATTAPPRGGSHSNERTVVNNDNSKGRPWGTVLIALVAIAALVLIPSLLLANHADKDYEPGNPLTQYLYEVGDYFADTKMEEFVEAQRAEEAEETARAEAEAEANAEREAEAERLEREAQERHDAAVRELGYDPKHWTINIDEEKGRRVHAGDWAFSLKETDNSKELTELLKSNPALHIMPGQIAANTDPSNWQRLQFDPADPNMTAKYDDGMAFLDPLGRTGWGSDYVDPAGTIIWINKVTGAQLREKCKNLFYGQPEVSYEAPTYAPVGNAAPAPVKPGTVTVINTTPAKPAPVGNAAPEKPAQPVKQHTPPATTVVEAPCPPEEEKYVPPAPPVHVPEVPPAPVPPVEQPPVVVTPPEVVTPPVVVPPAPQPPVVTPPVVVPPVVTEKPKSDNPADYVHEVGAPKSEENAITDPTVIPTVGDPAAHEEVIGSELLPTPAAPAPVTADNATDATRDPGNVIAPVEITEPAPADPTIPAPYVPTPEAPAADFTDPDAAAPATVAPANEVILATDNAAPAQQVEAVTGATDAPPAFELAA